ncbi:hypothetical protein LZ30DRAFT_456760 [Colletotrichum cereale]|nr:hypothetical protein LZ30DRAFT_456760 [Colletotrichum cereale]
MEIYRDLKPGEQSGLYFLERNQSFGGRLYELVSPRLPGVPRRICQMTISDAACGVAANCSDEDKRACRGDEQKCAYTHAKRERYAGADHLQDAYFSSSSLLRATDQQDPDSLPLVRRRNEKKGRWRWVCTDKLRVVSPPLSSLVLRSNFQVCTRAFRCLLRGRGWGV